MTTPTRGHLTQVAKELQRLLGTEPFVTVERRAVTEMIHEISGADGTRMKAAMAAGLEEALRDQGVRCFPSLKLTTTGDVVRFYPTGSSMGELIDLLSYPDVTQDGKLIKVLTKTRTVWNMTRTSRP